MSPPPKLQLSPSSARSGLPSETEIRREREEQQGPGVSRGNGHSRTLHRVSIDQRYGDLAHGFDPPATMPIFSLRGGEEEGRMVLEPWGLRSAMGHALTCEAVHTHQMMRPPGKHKKRTTGAVLADFQQPPSPPRSPVHHQQPVVFLGRHETHRRTRHCTYRLHCFFDRIRIQARKDRYTLDLQSKMEGRRGSISWGSGGQLEYHGEWRTIRLTSKYSTVRYVQQGIRLGVTSD